MTDEKLDLNRRKLLKSAGVAGMGLVGLTGSAAAKKRYPTVDEYGVFEDRPLEAYAIEAVKQPHHDRIAFTTTAFGDGYELYLADGLVSVEDTPKKVLKVTDDSLFVFSPEWLKGNRLQYQRGFSTLVRKVPLSNKEFDPIVVEEDTLRGGDE